MTRSLAALIDAVHLAAETERTLPALATPDPALLTEAVTAIAEGKAAIVADPSLARIALDQLDALHLHLTDLRRFRMTKLLGCSTCPESALPAEREYFANLQAARATLTASWPSVIHHLRDEA